MSARVRHGLLACALAALAVVPALGTWASGQRAAAAGPDQLACPGVDLAPRLASDRGTPATQTLDARGRYVPIVMVHGWTSRATHSRSRTGTFSHLIDLSTNVDYKPDALRSLIGQLQRIPGAAVFTFDYHDYSAQWVTDPHLGPALGDAIDCLASKTGEKVIVVGHSMGGLIARYAVTHDGADGQKRSRHVSTVVTFGTPETGSLIAKLAFGELDNDPALVIVRMILADCGARTAAKFETGTPCDILPAFLKAFDTPAGRALEIGSRQLRDLAPFPKGVTVIDALAGETTLKVRDMGWFADPWKTHDVDVGDLIVMSRSATHGASSAKVGHCAYQLNAVRGATDQIGLSLGQVSASDVAQPLWKVFGPCFHTNLMRTQELTNEATGAIEDDISRRPPNTTPQPPLTPEAVADDVLPVCRDYKGMSGPEKDVVLRRMQESHHDTMPRIVEKLSVAAFCALNPGRHIDGVYAPKSRSNPADGGTGPLPTCSEWRDMDDAASDAALLRLARQRGDKDPSISTLRLVVGVYCKLRSDHRIDEAPGG